MRKVEQGKIVVGSAAVLALACAVLFAHTGMFGIAPDGENIAGPPQPSSYRAGAPHP